MLVSNKTSSPNKTFRLAIFLAKIESLTPKKNEPRTRIFAIALADFAVQSIDDVLMSRTNETLLFVPLSLSSLLFVLYLSSVIFSKIGKRKKAKDHKKTKFAESQKQSSADSKASGAPRAPTVSSRVKSVVSAHA